MSSPPFFLVCFEPNFVQWIRIFDRTLSTCVRNSGFTTDIFFVKCGVRLGDPLSPLLSSLHWKCWYVKLKDDKNMKGFLVNGEEIKGTLFAYDITCFLRDTNSYFQLLTSFQNFATFSGLYVNDEKTEIFAIGLRSLYQDVFTHKICSMIKIFGVNFDYHTVPAVLKANCDFIQGTLNSWKGRCLTLIGKTQIIKSFVILKFLFLFLKSTFERKTFYLTWSFKRPNGTINNTGTKLLQKAAKKEQTLLLLI